ncbi:MAG: hypothetical protein K1X52_11510 [Pyrinomonadaceae bacterium]|nr:hypothetical protein [Pyrinomonadaceae bacterium]
MTRSNFEYSTGIRLSGRIDQSRRDSKLCTIGEGTSEIQRIVIAKNLLKA